MMPELKQKNALYRIIFNEKNAKKKVIGLAKPADLLEISTTDVID